MNGLYKPQPFIVRAIGIALLAALVAVVIAGCAGNPPRVIEVPKEVRVPVPVPCVKDAPAKPAFVSDGELAAMDDYTLVLNLEIDRQRRQQYEGTLEAVVAGCR